MNGPIFVDGVWRMDWGYHNPNLTAAMILCLMAAVWVAAYVWRAGFWAALPLFGGLVVCLVHTMSRGGLLGGVCGMGALAALAPRPWPRRRLLAVLAVACAGLVSGVFLKNYGRIWQGMVAEDKSISNRLLVWKAGPRMLADAPFGWGLNRVGEAYMEWYQPWDRREEYGSLVNTHLTKVVELGLLGGAAYLTLWGIALVMAWPLPRARWLAVPFSILVGFGVSALFTNMGRNPSLWILPVAGAIAAVAERIRTSQWPRRKTFLSPLLFGVCLAGGLYLAGKMQGGLPIRGGINGVRFGDRGDRVQVLVDEAVLGKRPGRALRRDHAACGPIHRRIWLPAKNRPARQGFGGTLVLTGTVDPGTHLGSGASNGVAITLLNPRLKADTYLRAADEDASVSMCYGEFAERVDLPGWKVAAASGRAKIAAIPGAGEYLADWPTLLRGNDAASPPGGHRALKSDDGPAPHALHTARPF